MMEGLKIVINGFEIFVHQSILIWLVLCLFVGLLLVYAGSKIKKADPQKAPSGLVLVFEVISKACIGIIGGNLKNKTWKYIPFLGTVMILMVISNLLGLLGLQAPTSNLSVGATLSLMVVALIHYTDIKLHGLMGKLRAWCEPLFFLFPLNIIGDLAFPLSLTLRLFGNMLGGTIIVALLYLLIRGLLPYSFVAYIATPFLHMYFDVFSAFMQTYIYFSLASFFLSESSDVE